MSGWDERAGATKAPDHAPAQATAPESEEHRPNPQDKGWAVNTSFDYELFNSEDVSQFPWAANSVRYEWKDQYGDVAPRLPELECQLFGATTRVGIEFSKLREISVEQEGTVRIKPVRSFAEAGLHPVMLENIELAKYHVSGPTPIQAYCMPAIAKGLDILACAQTGSGKTSAYIIPIISKLIGKAKKWAAPRPEEGTFAKGEPLLLVVCPSRELATQIFDEARRFSYRSMLRPCVVYGGAPKKSQRDEILRGCDILIGTPGRLCDFLRENASLSLARLRYMVIDEADEMLKDSWCDDLHRIMEGYATFPKQVRELAKNHLKNDHVLVKVGRAGSTLRSIKQDIVLVEERLKKKAVVDLLMSLEPGRAIIFVNTIKICEHLDDYLFNLDIPCTSMHANRTQLEREDALRAFRSAKCPILVTTGVSARGLDIENVQYVINYDLPSMMHGGIEEYTHRIGRTGRIGNTGLAVSFFNAERDEGIAPQLTMTLLETDQTIPEFLQEYVPEGGASAIRFDAEEDPSLNFGNAEWGNEGSNWATPAAGGPGDQGWGPGPAPTDQGWGASLAPTEDTHGTAPTQKNDGWSSIPTQDDEGRKDAPLPTITNTFQTMNLGEVKGDAAQSESSKPETPNTTANADGWNFDDDAAW